MYSPSDLLDKHPVSQNYLAGLRDNTLFIENYTETLLVKSALSGCYPSLLMISPGDMGSRDLSSMSSLVALHPGELVKTVARPPVMLIYLPPHTAPRAEIVLARDDGFTHVVYRQQFDLPESAGLLRVPFLDDAGLVAFIPDDAYYWRFTLIYAIRGRGEPEAISGGIQRVAIAPEVQTQLGQASPRE